VGKRYVAKTYNNRSFLRIILGSIIFVFVLLLVLFLLLFFILEGYYVDGSLNIPWLTDDPG